MTLLSVSESSDDLLEYLLEHRFGQAPGLRVVAAAMVAIDEDAAIVQHMLSSMRKPMACGPLPEGTQRCIMRDFAQREHDFNLRRTVKFILQVFVATLYFIWNGLIFRRQTLHRISNAAAGETQTIARVFRAWLATKTEAVQCSIKQQTGVIAGERTPGSICAMHSGRQANDQQARLHIAERCHRAGVIARMPCPHRIQERREPRTVAAVWFESGRGWRLRFHKRIAGSAF